MEKPLDMEELKQALGEAVETRRTMSTHLAASRSHEKEQLGHLTLLLTEPEPESLDEAGELIGSLGLPINSSTCFSALLLDSQTPVTLLPENRMDEVRDSFSSMLADRGIGQMYFIRADRYIIIFLYSDARQEEKLIHDCAAFLSKQLNEISRFFVSVGPVVSGVERAHISYMEAKEHLKESFFHEYGFILDKDTANAPFHPPADVLLEFSMALAEKQEDQALKLAGQLYQSFVPNDVLGPSQVKDIYYKYLSKLDEHGMNNYISLWQKEGLNTESIWAVSYTHLVRASSGSRVTITVVSLNSLAISLIFSLMDSLITPSRALKGSSSSRILGFMTMVLASATLCFCPPESWSIRLHRCSLSPKRSMNSSTSWFVEIPGRFLSPYVMFLYTLRLGNSA